LQVRARRLAVLGSSRVLYFRLKTEFAISFEGEKNFNPIRKPRKSPEIWVFSAYPLALDFKV
jgi:hypothetical protein